MANILIFLIEKSYYFKSYFEGVGGRCYGMTLTAEQENLSKQVTSHSMVSFSARTPSPFKSW